MAGQKSLSLSGFNLTGDMKKLILLLAAALLLMPACTKQPTTISPGMYSAWTYEGTLWLEMPEGGDKCYLHFDNRRESTGYYRISGSEIFLSAYVSSDDGLCVFDIDEPGIVRSSTEFSLPYKKPDKSNGWASFSKRIR